MNNAFCYPFNMIHKGLKNKDDILIWNVIQGIFIKLANITIT